MRLGRVIAWDKEKLLCAMCVLFVSGVVITIAASHESRDERADERISASTAQRARSESESHVKDKNLSRSEDLSDNPTSHPLLSEDWNGRRKIVGDPRRSAVRPGPISPAPIETGMRNDDAPLQNGEDESSHTRATEPATPAIEAESPTIIGVDGAFPYFDSPGVYSNGVISSRAPESTGESSRGEHSSREGVLAARGDVTPPTTRKETEIVADASEAARDLTRRARGPQHRIKMSSESGVPGQIVIMPLDLRVNPAQMPSALQLDLHFNPHSISLLDVNVGPASEAAGKGVIYRSSPRGTARVLVAGLNNDVLSGGTIAYLRFQILGNAPKGAARVSITSQLASDPNGEKVRLSARDGMIFIREEG